MEKTAATLKVGDQVHCLSERGATLGRASDNTIVLDDDSVSSHHAEIFMLEGVYRVRDLGSTNGTTLSGVPVTEADLNSDGILSFGTVEAVFLVDPQVLESSASEDQQSTEQSNSSQKPSHLSMGDKIKQIGQAAWAETKRSSHVVSLKAQIEKLRRIDLRHAFHDLGKTCYDSKIGEEKFPDHFNAIRSLQERIADGRKGVHAAEGATAGETKPVNVDLVETFNWLLGLTVLAQGSGGGVNWVEGTNPEGEKVLVLWRNTREVDADALNTWCKKQKVSVLDGEFSLIYINGDHHLENLRRDDQTWKVRLIDEEFPKLMWEGCQ